jgi:hypothetical protein
MGTGVLRRRRSWIVSFCLFVVGPAVGPLSILHAEAPVLRTPAGTPPGATLVFDIGSKTGDPYANLPAGARQISRFGERAVYSPDGKKIAFIGRSYGDAFEYDVVTHKIRNLTSHAPNAGYLRVHYLNDGNFVLLGPAEVVTNRAEARRSKIRLWFLNAAADRAPLLLGEYVLEGIAVSRESNKIAWTSAADNIWIGVGGLKPKPGTFAHVYTGIVTVTGEDARLTDIQEVFRRETTDCFPEPQDFRDHDRELTHSCYRVESIPSPGLVVTRTGVWGARLDTGALIRYRGDREGEYTEPEGISPDGRWELVECGRTVETGIDLCRLVLTPDSTDFKRVTHVLDYGGYKASNPVVSPDGAWVAFQSGRAQEEPGVGYGIFVMPMPGNLR